MEPTSIPIIPDLPPLIDRMECSQEFWDRLRNNMPHEDWQGFMGIPVYITDAFPFDSEEDGKPCIVHGMFVNRAAFEMWKDPTKPPPPGPWIVRLIEYTEPKA